MYLDALIHMHQDQHRDQLYQLANLHCCVSHLWGCKAQRGKQCRSLASTCMHSLVQQPICQELWRVRTWNCLRHITTVSISPQDRTDSAL